MALEENISPAEQEDLRAVIDSTPNVKAVAVLKNIEGKFVWQGRISADLVDEALIQKKWGAGYYRCNLMGTKNAKSNSYLRALLLDIGEPGSDETPAGETAIAATSAAAHTLKSTEAFYKEQLDRTYDLLKTTIVALRSEGGGAGLKETFAMCREMMEMNRPSPQPAVQDAVANALLKGMELASKMNGPTAAPASSEGMSFLREILTDFRPLLREKLQGAAAAAGEPAGGATTNNPPAEPAVEGDEVEIDIQPGLDLLKAKLNAGKSPEFIAELVLDYMLMDQTTEDIVHDLISRPFDEVLALDPEFAQSASLGRGLYQVYEALRARISADPDNSGGPGGDAANVGSHARPGGTGTA